MSMNLKGAILAGAAMGVGMLAACSDSATGPSQHSAFIPKASFVDVGASVDVAPPLATELRICKAGNIGGVLTVVNAFPGGGGTGNPTIITDQDAGTAGTQVALSPGAGGAPNCVLAVIDLGDANQEKGDFFTVTEAPQANVTTSRTCYINDGNSVPDACPPNFFINTAHGWTVVITNTHTPPPRLGCTYTKGWYQNKNGAPTIVLTIDGRTPDEQRAIFAATPGKPGNVTWTGGNNTLNLYQQLLAALNNLDNDLSGAPADVVSAINDALAATGGSGTHITVAADADVGGLTATLSSFNEGAFTGWPHCDD